MIGNPERSQAIRLQVDPDLRPSARVGALLRQIREKHGVTLRTLAASASIAASWLSDIERGRAKRSPDRDTLLHLAEFLKCGFSETGALLEAAEYRPLTRTEIEHRFPLSGQAAQLQDTGDSGPMGDYPLLPQPVGRDRFVDRVRGLLSSPEIVVVVTGEPGIGKTSVALQVARTASRAGRVALWADARGGYGASAEQLTSFLWGQLVGGKAPAPPEQTLHLMRRSLTALAPLIVIDNFESASQPEQLLRIARTLAQWCPVLITSRHAAGTRLGARNIRLGILGRRTSQELFGQVGERNDQRIATPEDGELIEFIVWDQLRGHPGAIEIAASLWGRHALSDIARGLANRPIERLVDERRTDLNQSMLKSIDFSYDLLRQDSPAASDAFPELSIFPSTFSVLAAEKVTEREALSSILAVLVDRSLARLYRERYEFHPVVRQYGLYRLGDRREHLRDSFVQFFTYWAAQGRKDYTVLDEERANMFAAIDFCLAEQVLPDCLDLLTDVLADYMHVRGLWSQRISFAARSLRLAELIEDQARLYVALHQLGNGLANVGRVQDSRTVLERALAVAEQLGSKSTIAVGSYELAETLHLLGEEQAAEELARRAVQLFDDLGDGYQQKGAQRLMGLIRARLGDYESAEQQLPTRS